MTQRQGAFCGDSRPASIRMFWLPTASAATGTSNLAGVDKCSSQQRAASSSRISDRTTASSGTRELWVSTSIRGK